MHACTSIVWAGRGVLNMVEFYYVHARIQIPAMELVDGISFLYISGLAMEAMRSNIHSLRIYIISTLSFFHAVYLIISNVHLTKQVTYSPELKIFHIRLK